MLILLSSVLLGYVAGPLADTYPFRSVPGERVKGLRACMEGHETSEAMTSFVKSEAFLFCAHVLSISLCCLMKYQSKGNTMSENTWFPGQQTGGVRTLRDECFEVCGQGDLKFCIWGSENSVCKTVPDVPAWGLAVCCCGLMFGEQPLRVAVGWNSNSLMLALKADEVI